jgi:AraC family transcriptional regulator of adaptative response/methylated-DNA-[protein]-cysteine methyltransferase
MSNSDAARVERAIRYIEEHRHGQPDLAQVAAASGLSEYHFQRLFKRWAGVSPKRFLQYLTAEHARALLGRSRTVLDTALDTGLSGPSRLHDLTVNAHALSPGEIRRRGEGISIRYGFHPSPFGECLLMETKRGITALAFVTDAGREHALNDLSGRWPKAALTGDDRATRATAKRVFAGSGELALDVRGTNFQVRVWEALLRVPEGTLTTYSGLAHGIGMPGAARAVGSAVAANPISLLIPCHRVIRSTGSFGNYRWGAARKQAMVGWEAARRERAKSSA